METCSTPTTSTASPPSWPRSRARVSRGWTPSSCATWRSRLRELADHVEVHALGILDDSGYTDDKTGMAAGPWFASRAGLPAGAARVQVQAARMLRRFPEVDLAWLDGDLSREHVRV